MSLQSTYYPTSRGIQNKLFQPDFFARYAERVYPQLALLREQFLTLMAFAQQNKLRVLLFVAAFFLLGLGAFVVSFLRVPSASASASALVPAVAAATGVRPLEMHIADNGLMLLRSAHVAAISGSTITLTTAWGSTEFSWVVHTDTMHYGTRTFGTKFLTLDGKQSSISELHIGDLVTITGMLEQEAAEPTIKADSVRLLKN